MNYCSSSYINLGYQVEGMGTTKKIWGVNQINRIQCFSTQLSSNFALSLEVKISVIQAVSIVLLCINGDIFQNREEFQRRNIMVCTGLSLCTTCASLPYPRERGPTTEYQPTPHFGLNLLLRSNVYSNMRPCVAALENAAQMAGYED